MTRAEAINALKEGKRLTHPRFNDDEWVEGANSRFYRFDDNCRCTAAAFWEHRKHPVFDFDWVELKKLTQANTGKE